VVCLSACLLVITVSPMEIVELMEMLLGMKIHRGHKKPCIRWGQDSRCPCRKGTYLAVDILKVTHKGTEHDDAA